MLSFSKTRSFIFLTIYKWHHVVALISISSSKVHEVVNIDFLLVCIYLTSIYVCIWHLKSHSFGVM